MLIEIANSTPIIFIMPDIIIVVGGVVPNIQSDRGDRRLLGEVYYASISLHALVRLVHRHRRE